MYKSSFLFFSIILAVAAVSLQSGGARWGDFTFAVKAESRADVVSLNDDARFVRAQVKATPTVLRTLWFDVQADLKELKADAADETKLAAERFSTTSPYR